MTPSVLRVISTITGTLGDMNWLWTILVILAIVALVLFIVRRR